MINQHNDSSAPLSPTEQYLNSGANGSYRRVAYTPHNFEPTVNPYERIGYTGFDVNQHYRLEMDSMRREEATRQQEFQARIPQTPLSYGGTDPIRQFSRNPQWEDNDQKWNQLLDNRPTLGDIYRREAGLGGPEYKLGNPINTPLLNPDPNVNEVMLDQVSEFAQSFIDTARRKNLGLSYNPVSLPVDNTAFDTENYGLMHGVNSVFRPLVDRLNDPSDDTFSSPVNLGMALDIIGKPYDLKPKEVYDMFELPQIQLTGPINNMNEGLRRDYEIPEAKPLPMFSFNPVINDDIHDTHFRNKQIERENLRSEVFGLPTQIPSPINTTGLFPENNLVNPPIGSSVGSKPVLGLDMFKERSIMPPIGSFVNKPALTLDGSGQSGVMPSIDTSFTREKSISELIKERSAKELSNNIKRLASDLNFKTW